MALTATGCRQREAPPVEWPRANLPLYRLRTAFFGQTNGHLHILFPDEAI